MCVQDCERAGWVLNVSPAITSCLMWFCFRPSRVPLRGFWASKQGFLSFSTDERGKKNNQAWFFFFYSFIIAARCIGLPSSAAPSGCVVLVTLLLDDTSPLCCSVARPPLDGAIEQACSVPLRKWPRRILLLSHWDQAHEAWELSLASLQKCLPSSFQSVLGLLVDSLEVRPLHITGMLGLAAVVYVFLL